MSRSIEKWSIYATRIDEDHPWYWWARPPWSGPVRFKSWADAVSYLTMRYNLGKPERS